MSDISSLHALVDGFGDKPMFPFVIYADPPCPCPDNNGDGRKISTPAHAWASSAGDRIKGAEFNGIKIVDTAWGRAWWSSDLWESPAELYSGEPVL